MTIHSMRFKSDDNLSDYERRRRASEGDISAKANLDYAAKLPLVESLRDILATLIGVAFVTSLIIHFGFIQGVFVGTVALLLVPIGQRLGSLNRLADKIAAAFRPYILKTVNVMRPLLSLLSRRYTTNVPSVYSHEELLETLKHSEGVLSSDELGRLKASLVFDSKTVGSVMTPRSNVDSVDVSERLGPLVLDSLHKIGRSRFPVIDGDINHVVGVLYLRDLIDLRTVKDTVKKAMDPRVYYLHEDQSLAHALHGFLRTHHHLFIVINDRRETVGLLTLEDVIESLVGKIIIDRFDRFDDLRAVATHNPRQNNHTKAKEDT